MIDTLLRDLRFAWRGLMRSPGFTAVAAATLALGVGANSATFTVVNAVVMRPLPYTQPERLVRLTSDFAGLGSVDIGVSQPVEVRANDPFTSTLIAVMLTATAALAAWLPARRAASVDPITALRAD